MKKILETTAIARVSGIMGIWFLEEWGVIANDGFNPGANDCVYSIACQADGKIPFGGHFTQVAGVIRNCIARLNVDKEGF